ncbi:MAG: class I SAM-dependent methyltransferase [Planctomycetota bacterium]|nr:MAG: class I SAM-dependent methyltransferase [Planctomycetota bacterium]
MTESTRRTRSCRLCDAGLETLLCDLGLSPVSNALVREEDLERGEVFHPLKLWLCENCKLVQLEEFEPPEAIFDHDYAYFSSYADSWLAHCRRYVAHVVERFGLGAEHRVVEIASNDGYLLQYFLERGIPVLGIEPAANVAEAARAKGIPTEQCFFGAATAQRLLAEGVRADLLVANNVLAHVPRLNDFAAGLALVLAPRGVLTVEFPHLLELLRNNQFDTIYHEHFSYLSLFVVEQLFERHGLRVFDVQQLPTHGGSLRVFACHRDDPRPEEPGLAAVRRLERAAGIDTHAGYGDFSRRVVETKLALLETLIALHRQGLRVCGYGAPAKATTLLNYCGVGPELLPFTVDRSPQKQGRYIPGVRIPIRAPQEIDRLRPDRILILPWNLTDEITAQLDHARRWGARFVVAIPRVRTLP